MTFPEVPDFWFIEAKKANAEVAMLRHELDKHTPHAFAGPCDERGCCAVCHEPVDFPPHQPFTLRELERSRMMTTYPDVPALDHDRMMAERYGYHRLGARGHNERRIVWRMMHHLAAHGFNVIAVVHDERDAVESPKEAMEIIFNLDDSKVVFEHRDTRDRHTVLLILGNGNGGFDLVSDWSFSEGDADGFDAAMNGFCELLENGRI